MGRRGERGRDSRHYYDWLEFAAEDLHCASILLAEKQCLNAVGFHCQQAMEKALKSFIMYHTGAPVDGHNITWLCKTAGRHDAQVLGWLEMTPIMNRMYIECRYPADLPPKYTLLELETILNMATELYEYICKVIYRQSDPEEE